MVFDKSSHHPLLSRGQLLRGLWVREERLLLAYISCTQRRPQDPPISWRTRGGPCSENLVSLLPAAQDQQASSTFGTLAPPPPDDTSMACPLGPELPSTGRTPPRAVSTLPFKCTDRRLYFEVCSSPTDVIVLTRKGSTPIDVCCLVLKL